VQLVLRGLLGSRWSWGVVAVAFALGSFGVYLGRFVRFNSWDVLIRPARIAHVIGNQVENPLHHPRMVATLLVLTIFLLVGYALFYGLAEMHLELHAKDRESLGGPRRTSARPSQDGPRGDPTRPAC